MTKRPIKVHLIPDDKPMHQFWLPACVWNPTFPVAFRSLYNSVTEEIRATLSLNSNLCILSSEISATFITCYLKHGRVIY